MLNPRRSVTKKKDETLGADVDNEIQMDKPVITKKRGRKTVVGEFDIEQEGLKVEREREPSFLKGESDRPSIVKGEGERPSLNKPNDNLEDLNRMSQKNKLPVDDNEETKTNSPNRNSEKNSPSKKEAEELKASDQLPTLKMEPIGRASRGLKKLFDDSDEDDGDLFKPKNKR